MSIINEQLQSWQYYLQKVPMWLRKSERFCEHFKIWYDLLINVVNTSDNMLELLNIFDENYLENIDESMPYYISGKYKTNVYNVMTEFETFEQDVQFEVNINNKQVSQLILSVDNDNVYTLKLDGLAAYQYNHTDGALTYANYQLIGRDTMNVTYDFGDSLQPVNSACYRYLSTLLENFDTSESNGNFLDMLASLYGISRYINVKYSTRYGDVDDNIVLTDSELLIYIKFAIIKNYFKGSREELEEYYQKTGLNIELITSYQYSATVDQYLVDRANLSDNIIKMFLAGYFRVESMGITYNSSDIDLDSLLVFDQTGNNRRWDVGRWL